MKRSRFSFRVRDTSEKSNESVQVQDTTAPAQTRYSMNNFGYKFNTSSYTGSDIGFLEEFSETAEEDDYTPPMRRVLSAPVTATIASLHRAALTRAVSSEGKLSLAPIVESQPTVELVEDVTVISEGEDSIFTSNGEGATDAGTASTKSSFDSTPTQDQSNTIVEEKSQIHTPKKEPSIDKMNKEPLTVVSTTDSTTTTQAKEQVVTSPAENKLPVTSTGESISWFSLEGEKSVVPKEECISKTPTEEKEVAVLAQEKDVESKDKAITTPSADKSVKEVKEDEDTAKATDDNHIETPAEIQMADTPSEKNTSVEQNPDELPSVNEEMTEQQKAAKRKVKARRVSKVRKPPVWKSFSIRLRNLMQRSAKHQEPKSEERVS